MSGGVSEIEEEIEEEIYSDDFEEVTSSHRSKDTRSVSGEQGASTVASSSGYSLNASAMSAEPPSGQKSTTVATTASHRYSDDEFHRHVSARHSGFIMELSSESLCSLSPDSSFRSATSALSAHNPAAENDVAAPRHVSASQVNRFALRCTSSADASIYQSIGILRADDALKLLVPAVRRALSLHLSMLGMVEDYPVT